MPNLPHSALREIRPCTYWKKPLAWRIDYLFGFLGMNQWCGWF